MSFPPTDTSEHRLLVAISVHYRPDRLHYLFDVLRTFAEFQVGAMEVHVVTNATDPRHIASIDALCSLTAPGHYTYAIDSFGGLDDPQMLAWCHKPLIRDRFLHPDLGFTHFVHVEEDIRFSALNFQYWLAFRTPLDEYGLLPGFVRIEYRQATKDIVASDAFRANTADESRFLRLGPYTFAALANPHHAMFVLDRTLAQQYVASRSFDVEGSREVYAKWWTVERSEMGVAFEDIPAGYECRYVVPLDPATRIPAVAGWVHHLPNNYADAEHSPSGLGRVAIRTMFSDA